MAMTDKIRSGLNDAGIIYSGVNAFYECVCGFTLPSDSQAAPRPNFPNWERFREHVNNCAVHRADFEANKRKCNVCREYYHRNDLVAGDCERCIQNGE